MNWLTQWLGLEPVKSDDEEDEEDEDDEDNEFVGDYRTPAKVEEEDDEDPLAPIEYETDLDNGILYQTRSHECNPPTLTQIRVESEFAPKAGDRWICDECNRTWKLEKIHQTFDVPIWTLV